jgi:hypothetical protein
MVHVLMQWFRAWIYYICHVVERWLVTDCRVCCCYGLLVSINKYNIKYKYKNKYKNKYK